MLTRRIVLFNSAENVITVSNFLEIYDTVKSTYLK